MSYLPTGFDKAEREALSVPIDTLRNLPASQKLDYMMRHREIKAQERSAFWDAIGAAVPVLIALGVGTWLGGKK